MKSAFAVVLASLALLCIPTALALSAPDLSGVQVPVAIPQAPHVDLPADVGAAVAGTVQTVGIDAKVQVATPGSSLPAENDGTIGMAPTSASFQVWGPKATAIAQEAAGASLLTVLMVAYTNGLDGLRAVLGRPGARLQQAGRFLLRFLPFVPLFSRIEGQKLLDNPVRARVHEVVVQDPGLSLEEVRSRTGIAHGTAVHHLRRLEDNGLLVSVAHSARRRYFAANTDASRRRVAVAALAHPTARKVADLVRQRPGVDQSGLCEALGLRNPAASKHLSELASQGLVLQERQGRRCHYHPTQALHAAFGILESPVVPVVVHGRTVGAPTA